MIKIRQQIMLLIMKKIFLFLLIISSIVSYGQTYNPANFTVSNKSYAPAQSVPTDARYNYFTMAQTS